MAIEMHVITMDHYEVKMGKSYTDEQSESGKLADNKDSSHWPQARFGSMERYIEPRTVIPRLRPVIVEGWELSSL